MKIWEINKIPICDIDNEKQLLNIQQAMKSVLYLLQGNEKSCIEIMFFHESGDDIRIFVLLYGNMDIAIYNAIEAIYQGLGYQLIAEEDSFELHKRIYEQNRMNLCAVMKTEKIVTTPYVYEGYYFWADKINYEKESVYDNFTVLFHTMQHISNSFVSFQLMPTVLQPHEQMSIANLSAFIEPHLRTPRLYNDIYEPYAEAANLAYRNILEASGEPLLLYNIIAGAPGDSVNPIINDIIALIKTSAKNSPELQSVNFQIEEINDQNYGTFPMRINSMLMYQYRNLQIWKGMRVTPDSLFRLPYIVTLDEALSFFHLPVDDGKIVGIRSTNYISSNELLGTEVTMAENIIFGNVLGSKAVRLGTAKTEFSKHALIVGMPGFGKTTFSINLLLQFYKKGTPFLAIEPTKAEYRAMIKAIPDLQVFTPGNSEVSPFIINPFLPPSNVKLEIYIPSLVSAFQAAFSMPSPLDNFFEETIRSCYIYYGWRDYSKRGDSEVIEFGLHEYICHFKKEVQKSGYKGDIKSNLESGGVLRLSNLLAQNKNIFDTSQTIPVEDLLNKPTILELNAIENQEQKALIIALLLINISVYIKNCSIEPGVLKNLIMIDEAHVLLNSAKSSEPDKANPQNKAVSLVENMIAELRSYGTGVILADQRPSVLGSSIVANTDIKISFRLTERAEKEIISNSVDLNENMYQQLSRLSIGEAIVYYHNLNTPQLVQTPDIRDEENISIGISDEEVRKHDNYWKSHSDLLKPYYECKFCLCDNNRCDYHMRADADYYASFIWNRIRQEVSTEEQLLTYINGVPKLIASYLEAYGREKRNKLIICIRIALMRKCELDKGIVLFRSVKKGMLSSPEIRGKGEKNE